MAELQVEEAKINVDIAQKELENNVVYGVGCSHGRFFMSMQTQAFLCLSFCHPGIDKGLDRLR